MVNNKMLPGKFPEGGAGAAVYIISGTKEFSHSLDSARGKEDEQTGSTFTFLEAEGLKHQQCEMTPSKLKETYDQQGFLSALPVLDDAELREVKEAFSELESEFGEEYTQYSLHNVHRQYPWVQDLTKHPKLLQAVTAILGPDVILLDSRFICKYPALSPDGKAGENELPYVAWHQDMRYWGIDGGPVLSVWLALDDSLKENGALQVIPGSHCVGMLPHRQAIRPGNMLTVNQEIPEELVQADKAVLCPLLAGQMSVHDGFLVHASEANTSQRRRCGFVIRYVPTCAYPTEDPDRPRKFLTAELACGEDHFHHFSNKTTSALP